MRNGVTGDVSDLTIADDVTTAICVLVPAMGALLVGRPEGGDWRGVLVQPDADNRYSPASNQVVRPARVVDGVVEIELLPNSSGEDRLVVCVEGAT